MKKSLPILLTSLTLLAACDTTQTSYELNLNKDNVNLTIGESETLTLTLTPNDLPNGAYIWTIEDSQIASINKGTITALNEGITDVSVYLDLNQNANFDIGEPKDSASLTVVAPEVKTIPVTSVTLNTNSVSLAIDEEYLLVGNVLPAHATYANITWISSDDTIAAVDNGLVSAKQSGEASITAYVDENQNETYDENEKHAIATINVTEADATIYVTSVTLNKTSLTLEEGESEILSAVVTPSNTTTSSITWLTSNASIATVNNGAVVALNAGNATITAYVDENHNDSLDLIERKATLSLTVTEDTLPPDPGTELIPAKGESLPIGNKSVSGPNNRTPIDITEWTTHDFSSSLAPDWSYIMGNNKRTTGGDFYATASGGGFKFSQLYYGLQSPLLNSWLKTEVRLTISQFNNNSANQNQFEGKPIFHIYSYDKNGNYIAMQTFNQVNKFSDLKEIQFYIANPDMAYFEIRLNAFPYKGSQCYNFGISQIKIKGWPYGL